MFAGFSKSETLKHVRTKNNEDKLLEVLAIFKTHPLKRGYKPTEIDKSMRLAISNKSSDLLKQAQRNKKDIPLVFITKYHHAIRRIGYHLRKNWHKFKRDVDCTTYFNDYPIVAYCRHKNLLDYIINKL